MRPNYSKNEQMKNEKCGCKKALTGNKQYIFQIDIVLYFLKELITYIHRLCIKVKNFFAFNKPIRTCSCDCVKCE